MRYHYHLILPSGDSPDRDADAYRKRCYAEKCAPKKKSKLKALREFREDRTKAVQDIMDGLV